jgi:hypothetical protein
LAFCSLHSLILANNFLPANRALGVKVKFRFASFILAMYSIVGIGVVAFSKPEVIAALNLISYIFLYIIVPIYGAYGVWKQRLSSVILSLLFFTSQCIRPIAGKSWFPYAPPFSLCVPFGNFLDGQGYLFDFFATSMVIFLALLVWALLTSNKRLWRQ